MQGHLIADRHLPLAFMRSSASVRGAAWTSLAKVERMPASAFPLLVLAILLGSGALTAADPAAPTAPATGAAGPGAGVPSRQDAEQLADAGAQAMHESAADPARAVAAAVAFARALDYYQAAGDLDRVCDLEASIFWCTKRMSAEDVGRFVAGGHGDAGTSAALARVEALAAAPVAVGEAQAFFDRAARFANDHPLDAGQISVRYFEVAERFAGTALSLRAQKLSLAAQQQQAALLLAQQAAARQTLFTRRAAPAAAGAPAPTHAPPAEAALRAAVAAVRKLFKEDYARSRVQDKRRLAAKLLDQVAATGDDPVTQVALLDEAIELAAAGGDWYGVIGACDLLARTVTGIDATLRIKEALARARGNPVALAIITLLDHPNDAEANALVGKDACFEYGRWSIGLPLLAHGEGDFHAVAEMELLRPYGAAQQVELADAWCELGRKARPGARERILGRASAWYQLAAATITGITKQRIAARLDELDGLLPLANLDYGNLTPKQWDRLKGAVVEVSAGHERTDTGLSLARGQRIRVVAHPTDSWNCDYYGSTVRGHWTGVRGDGGGVVTTIGDLPFGAVTMQSEQGAPARPGILEGGGRVFLAPHAGPRGAAGKGVIRCKLVAVTEDDADSRGEPFAMIGEAPESAKRMAGRHVQRLAIGSGADGRLCAVALGADDLCYACAQDQRFAWHAAGALPNAARKPLAAIAAGQGPGAGFTVICLGREDGQPAILRLDAQGGWGEAEALPNPAHTPYAALATVTGIDQRLQVVCLGRDDGQPYLLSQDAQGGWTPGAALGNPGKIPFAAVAAGVRIRNRFAMLLIGRDDGQPALLWYDGRGAWSAVEALPDPGRTPLSAAVLAVGSDGYPQAIAIGRDDGQPYLIWQDIVTGTWAWSGALTDSERTPLGALVAGMGRDRKLQVIALGRDDGQPYLYWHNPQGKWSSLISLPQGASRTGAVASGQSLDGNLQVLCLGKDDSMPAVLVSDGITGMWTASGAPVPAAAGDRGDGADSAGPEAKLPGAWKRDDGELVNVRPGGEGTVAGQAMTWRMVGISGVLTYPGHPERSDRLVITGPDSARFITPATGKVQELVRDPAGPR